MQSSTLRDFYFIINPAAGKGSMQGNLIQQIRETLTADQYEIYCTTYPGDGERYTDELSAKALKENRQITIFACGGDGTFMEVVNGTKGRVPVGVIPCGSGNDFVKNIILSDNTALLDVSAQINGIITPVDLIRCNDRYIANVCNVGFDADVAHNMARFRRLPLVSGKLAYILSIVYCLLHPLGYNLTVQIDDEPSVNDTLLFTVIANGQIYGGSFKGAPLASVHDGLIDVCMCKKLNLLQLARFIGPFQNGTYLDLPSVQPFIRYQKCRRLQLTSDTPVYIGFDGDVIQTNTLDVEIMPNALQLIVPKGAHLK